MLQQELAAQAAARADADADEAPWREETGIALHVPQERAGRTRTDVVEGQECLPVPLEEGVHAGINGVAQTLSG